MAIETTVFNYPTSPNDNIGEVYDWLVENASDYFEGDIEKDTTSKRLLCYVEPPGQDNAPRIVIPFYNSAATGNGYVRAKYDTTNVPYNPNGGSYSSASFRRAVKTSCGFVLLSYVGTTLFVTRTTGGNVCILTNGGTASYNTRAFRYMFGDLEHSSSLAFSSYSTGTDDPSTLAPLVRFTSDDQITTLLPVVFPGGTYTDNMFMTQFTQANFYEDLQTVLIDGNEYIYDGFVALKA